MSLRDELARVVARDARYSIQAYMFVLESLEFAKFLKKRNRRGRRAGTRKPPVTRHISGRQLCEGFRELALRQFGLMALTVMNQWGIRSTSDVGEIVFHLIAAGELEQSKYDAREDFDDVFQFESALRSDYVMTLDDVA
jgi:uncharacterized repeat protein (TIGR04138 family)